MRHSAILGLLLAVALASGCSPAFDWREVRSVADLQLLMPCRPQAQLRQVVLGGQAMGMELTSCSAGGAVFAVSRTGISSPDQVTPVLRDLRAALYGNLSASKEVVLVRPDGAALDGSMAHPLAQRVVVEGAAPDGKPIRAEGLFFVGDHAVFQASVVGRRPDQEAVEFFYSSLKVLK